MTKYIDKEIVVSIIKERRDAAISRQKNLEDIGDESVLNEMVAFNLDKILEAIDSLEEFIDSKDIDLEKEFDKCCENYIFDDECDVYTAKRFFELGAKAQKGE